MSADLHAVKAIFLNAVDKADRVERAGYLDQACGADAELRRHVEALLAAHDAAGSFLAAPTADDEAATLAPRSAPFAATTEQSGQVIGGRYTLIQKLGEGGMGSVWVAEQTEPVKRRVALKMIRPGLGSHLVLRRFEAERQALALMDHPNIAKILDGGATASGQPFFVMELVKGVPITSYCDELHLSIRDRLKLFGPVCQAIQHAHQKGIIHRDIKPGNVMVAIQDGVPAPKVIDFGVAKAINQRLTEETMNTQIGAVVGTLEYMSPEQAELSELDIDTRADVYALGVLLYELLTGTTPINRAQLKDAAIFEMLRMIKQDEPPKPSTRLTESKELLAGLAVQRRTEPARLTKEVRGELDWIVMKCLEKDRTRRYESASGLAKDVERYLDDEVIEAGPPSARYRLSKFVRRNRPAVVTTATFILFLVLGTAVCAWQAVSARHARDQARKEAAASLLAQQAAEQAQKAEAIERGKAKRQAEIAEAVKRFLEQDLIGQADISAHEGGPQKSDPDLKLKTAIDRAAKKVPERFANQPLIEASVRRAIARAYFGRGLWAQALTQLERACEFYLEQIENNQGEAMHDTTVEFEYCLAIQDLANVHLRMGQADKAISVVRIALALAQKMAKRDPNAREMLRMMNDMFKLVEHTVKAMKGEIAANDSDGAKKAKEWQRRFVDITKLMDQGQYAKAEGEIKLLIVEEPPSEKDTVAVLSVMLGVAYLRQNKNEEALQTLQTARDGLKESIGPNHPALAGCDIVIGQVLLAQKKYVEAESKLRAASPIIERELNDSYTLFQLKSLLGAALAGQKKYADAEPMLLAGYEGLKARAANIPNHEQPILTEALERLVHLYDAWDKKDRAAEWRKKLAKAPAKP